MAHLAARHACKIVACKVPHCIFLESASVHLSGQDGVVVYSGLSRAKADAKQGLVVSNGNLAAVARVPLQGI